MRLLVSVGTRCAALMDAKLRDLTCRYIHCDGIWAFVHKKEKQVRIEDPEEGYIDVSVRVIGVHFPGDPSLPPAFIDGVTLLKTHTAWSAGSNVQRSLDIPLKLGRSLTRSGLVFVPSVGLFPWVWPILRVPPYGQSRACVRA
jgi:hypothetical protein